MEEQLQEWIMFLNTLKKSYLTETALRNGTLELHIENLLVSMKRAKKNLSNKK